MKRVILTMIPLLIVLTSVLASPAGALASEYSQDTAFEVIDPGRVAVRFRVRVFGVLSVFGHFDRLFGKFVSNAQGDRTGVRMQIDASSVSTNDEWRDGVLRGPGFFATDQFPDITFSGSCLGHEENGAMRLVGNLNLRGRSRPVIFEFDSPTARRANSAVIYQAKTVIRRSEFGLNAMEHLISDEVEIIVAMQPGSAD